MFSVNLCKRVRYVRKHFTSTASGDLQAKELQTAMGLLAFSPTTKCRRYQVKCGMYVLVETF